MKNLKDAKHQLKALLLRNNIHYKGTEEELNWLATEVETPSLTKQSCQTKSE